MKPPQTNVRLPDLALEQLSDLLRGGGNKTATIAAAIDRLWHSVFEISFNDACTQLGITAERRAFHEYWATVRDDECQCHTLEMWQTIYRCFETQRDHEDHDNTQQDALPSAS